MGMGCSPPPLGSPEEGVAPRAVRHIFERAAAVRAAQPGSRVTVTASFLEIHNEELRDLLAVPGQPPKVGGSARSLPCLMAPMRVPRACRKLQRILNNVRPAQSAKQCATCWRCWGCRPRWGLARVQSWQSCNDPSKQSPAASSDLLAVMGQPWNLCLTPTPLHLIPLNPMPPGPGHP